LYFWGRESILDDRSDRQQFRIGGGDAALDRHA
jgi:hypothetical protein